MAAERMRTLGGVDGVSISGVYSRTLEKAEAAGSSFGARGFDDFDEMLDAVDAVSICLSNDVHAVFARKALIAGKHVLIEYPLCTSASDADYLSADANRSGSVLMVGNTILHETMFKYLNENKARLGDLLNASARVAFFDGSSAGWWYMNEEKTGPRFAAMHYHFIEYFKRFVGKVDWVRGVDQSLPDDERPGYERLAGGTLFMGHEGNKTSSVQLYLSTAGNGTPRGLWINGTDASVTIVAHGDNRSLVIWNGGEDGTEEYENDWGVAGSSMDFIDAIQGKLDHRARLEDDITTMKLGILASESSKSGKIVDTAYLFGE
jgi:predicted dehydrogenase